MATFVGTAGNDSLVGGAGDDALQGLGGNDTLIGNGGNDLLDGGTGNDLVAGGVSGADTIDGGAGYDSIEFKTAATSAVVVDFAAGTITGGGPGTISFTNIERVVGGNFDDHMSGDAAGQNLTGQAGSDTLWGAGGVDTLWGGPGADTFIFRETGTSNADSVADFASGSDKLLLDASVMSALGAAGNFAAGDARFAANSTGTAQDASDRIVFNTSNGQVWYDADGSGSGARVLIATLQSGATLVATDIAVEGSAPPSGGQAINGTSGNDSLVGGAGNDTLRGLGGNDTLNGLAGNDLLIGGDGNDVLRDYDNHFEDPEGSDTLDGGLGNDTYDLRSDPFQDHNPVLMDAGGTDTVLSNHSFVLPDGFENLTIYEGVAGTGNALDNVISTRSNEPGQYFVDGADGNDTLIGGSDADTFRFAAGSGNYGHDVVDGGDGSPDIISFFGARSAVVVDMRAGTISGGGTSGAGSVTFAKIEKIEGSDFDDRLIGGAASDDLFGGIGNDTISGGAGNDVLSGYDGNDRFRFDVAPGAANADQIADFVSSSDKIELDNTAHANLGAVGNFSSADARFAANPTGTAQDASDRVVYNTGTGQLWYDADGNGSGSAQLIATVQGAPTLVATDVAVVGGGGSGGTVINGTSGNDTLAGTNGNDTINGLGGNDLFPGGSGGADVIDGGTGYDAIEFKAAATSAVVVDYGAGTITGGGPGTISFTNIERVVAGNFNDRMTGNAAAQNLTGQAGSDTLWGAGGADTLWGGSGADTFIFREMGTANADRMGDFASGSDKLHLDDVAFTSIGATGNFASGDGRFWAAAGATAGHDANDRVIYNTSTGSLYYDADGSGSSAAQLIATFTGNPAIAASDIVVI